MTNPRPAPAGSDGTVRPVIIDPATRRYLLHPAADAVPVSWTVPAVPMRPGEHYRLTTVRYLRHELRIPALRIAAVVGRLPAGRDRDRVEYLVLAAPPAAVWPHDVRARLASGARWWTTAQLRDAGVSVEPGTLTLLMEGYWEGWLPDGEISLE
ncbi:hypothetical protein [Streptomyces hokutonensis]|uniref:hypothetical protein n=1 Tax=Streptomyces hokutonensis TaxID=1306990 RepID=UPI00340E257D